MASEYEEHAPKEAIPRPTVIPAVMRSLPHKAWIRTAISGDREMNNAELEADVYFSPYMKKILYIVMPVKLSFMIEERS